MRGSLLCLAENDARHPHLLHDAPRYRPVIASTNTPRLHLRGVGDGPYRPVIARADEGDGQVHEARSQPELQQRGARWIAAPKIVADVIGGQGPDPVAVISSQEHATAQDRFGAGKDHILATIA